MKAMGRLALLIISVTALCACLDKRDTTPYQWELPYGLPEPALVDDRIMTKASVELGRHLFYDTQLSVNQSTACASCHQQGFAFAEQKTVSTGAMGQPLKRNALALVNLAYSDSFTWAHDGLSSIEAQLHLPLFNEFPIEMGVTGNEADILARFSTPDYGALFAAAYGDSAPNMENIIAALASFVRSLVSLNSDFDRYAYNGDDSALSPQAVQGLNLFFSERLECFHCHGGMNFTQSSQHASQSFSMSVFHNTGLGNHSRDSGLYAVTRNSKDKGKFKAPTLRNIAMTAPYMHDGSLQTLEDVVEFYAQGGRDSGINDPNKSAFINGFAISEEEKAALIAFLHSLTDRQFLMNPAHSAPYAIPD